MLAPLPQKDLAPLSEHCAHIDPPVQVAKPHVSFQTAANVDRDAHQPRLFTAFAAKGAPSFVCFQEHFLHRILCQVRIAEYGIAYPAQRGLMGIHRSNQFLVAVAVRIRNSVHTAFTSRDAYSACFEQRILPFFIAFFISGSTQEDTPCWVKHPSASL